MNDMTNRNQPNLFTSKIALNRSTMQLPCSVGYLLVYAAISISLPSFAASQEHDSNDQVVISANTAIPFDIPIQDLAQALSSFSVQSRVQVLYEGDITRGFRSNEVKGRYTPNQALRLLLSDTPVLPQFTDSRSVTLIKKHQPALDDLLKLAASDDYRITAEDKPYTGPVEQEDMTVQGGAWNSYNVSNANTATKTDTPILETPVSIQIVPQQLIRDQQAIRLEDAVKNVSGVHRDWGYGDLQQRFIIRGFSTDHGYFRNGVRMGNPEAVAESANVERIEILKGPAGMLYGRIQPGGMVNVVTKRPLLKPYYSVQQQIGSYELYRTTIDATGPILNDKSLAYRFNLAYQNSNSFRDYLYDEHVYLAPAFTWTPNGSTEFNLELEYYDGKFRHDSAGLPAIGNKPADIPISRWLGEPNNDGVDQSNIGINFNWSHALNSSWKIRNGVNINLYERTLENVVTRPLQADNRTQNRAIYMDKPKNDNYTAYFDLTGKFRLFQTDHNVLVGGEYYSFESTAESRFGTDSDEIGPIDIFNPVYGNANLDLARRRLDENPGYVNSVDEWYGIYFQDQITLWNQIHILGGGRYDWAYTSLGFSENSPSEAIALRKQNEIEATKFSPRVGLLYQPWSWFSIYGNYAESLGVSNGARSSTGEPFEPQESEQFEVGMKGDWFSGRLTSSLAYFHLTKTNILSADISTPEPFDSVAIGKARSQGIEFDIAGQITDRLSLVGTYAYTDAKITKDQGQDVLGNPTSGNQGNRLANVPEHAGSLWAKYWLLPEQFEMGAGVYLIGKRKGDNENTLDLAGYGRLDLFAAYHQNVGKSKFTAQINVHNVLDKKYYKNTNTVDGVPRVRILPGEPLTVLGSIRVEF